MMMMIIIIMIRIIFGTILFSCASFFSCWQVLWKWYQSLSLLNRTINNTSSRNSVQTVNSSPRKKNKNPAKLPVSDKPKADASIRGAKPLWKSRASCWLLWYLFQGRHPSRSPKNPFRAQSQSARWKLHIVSLKSTIPLNNNDNHQ